MSSVQIKNITSMFKKIVSSSLLKKTTPGNLGRWNSVTKRVPLEENKYIDWGNMDHCCCSTSFIEKKISS